MKMVGFFPDGVGIRNFILGSFLDRAVEAGEVQVFHQIPAELLSSYQGDNHRAASWHRCIPHRDAVVERFLRKSVSYAHLCWGDTRAMRFARAMPVKGRLTTRLLGHASRALGRAAASPRRIRWLEQAHHRVAGKQPEVQRYCELFQRLRPTVLFSSHQRPLEILAPVLAARQLGIPTATFIFSWDNITSKGRITAPFDHFLVWSNHMRDELLQYYPEYPAENVHVVGTPQFDPYADDSLLWSKAEFCQRVGADPNRKLICYSGGEPGTTPEDQHHLRVLMELIRAGKIRHRPQVLLRPAPVTRADERLRYGSVCDDYPEIIYCRPAWTQTKPGDFSTVIPQRADIQFLANLTEHADVNVNVASTMTLDFAIHGTPVVNIGFNVLDPPPFGVPLADHYYQFEHYRPVVELGAAPTALSPAELARHINAYLDDPDKDRACRQAFIELELDLPIGRASEKIIRVLERIGLPSSASPPATAAAPLEAPVASPVAVEKGS